MSANSLGRSILIAAVVSAGVALAMFVILAAPEQNDVASLRRDLSRKADVLTVRTATSGIAKRLERLELSLRTQRTSARTEPSFRRVCELGNTIFKEARTRRRPALDAYARLREICERRNSTK